MYKYTHTLCAYVYILSIFTYIIVYRDAFSKHNVLYGKFKEFARVISSIFNFLSLLDFRTHL